MSNRIIIRKILPEAVHMLDELTKSLDKISIEKDLSELPKLLVSHNNRCAYCIQLHTNGALQYGVSDDKLASLKDWRDSSYFSIRESIAFEMAESITEGSGNNLTMEICNKASKMFTQNEIAEIIMIISVINAWNRLSVSSKIYNSFVKD